MKKIKKIIIFNLIMICFLLIGTSCFGAKTWTKNEFETMLKSYGYGEIDLSSLTYTNTTYEDFINYLTKNRKKCIIKDNNKIFIILDKVGNFTQLNINKDNNTKCYYTSRNVAFIYDIENNNITDSYTNGIYPEVFKLENYYNINETEFFNKSFLNYLLEENILFSDIPIIYNSEYIFQNLGGKIISSSYENVTYKGEINYLNSLKKTQITYTQGFVGKSDLFLEIYKLDNDYENGISAYPTDTIQLQKVEISDTEVNVNLDEYIKSAYFGYRLCVGKNKFEESGENEVYLCTDWIIGNENTVWTRQVFYQRHYSNILSLIEYDPNYSESQEPPDQQEEPQFIYSPSGDINYNDNYLLVKNAKNIENYYLNIVEYSTDGKVSYINTIKKNEYYNPELWKTKSGDNYYINLNEKLVFFNNKIYQIELINPHGMVIDKSKYYTFINDFFENNPNWIPTQPNIKAGIINNLKGYYESTTSEELYLDIVIPSGEENNYQIQIEKMGIKNNWDNPNSSEYQSLITLNRTIISGELFTNENYTGIFYKIQLPNYYEFEVNNSLSEATNTGVGTDAYYKATLLKNYGTKIQETDIFYFSPLAKNPLTGIEGDNNDKDTGIIAEIAKRIKNILDSILNALFTPNMSEITQFINDMSTAMNGNNLLSLNLYIISSQLNLMQTQNVGDFIISYGDIELFNQTIIPANSINITQLVTQNQQLNTIYGYYKIIVTTIWIYLFASFLRNILFKILGLNWIGNLADYEESQTTKEYNRYDTDEDTGKITETKTYKRGKTTWNYRRKL